MSDRCVDYLAGFALSIRLEEVPDEVVRAAKIFLIDTVGVGLSGTQTDSARSVLATAKTWGSAESAKVLGHRLSLPIPSAAFVNAFQIHCQEFDCLHEPATVHAMAVLGGALLASAGAGRLDGRQLLLGVIIGVEVASCLGVAASSGLRFFRPATAGALATTAALARLSGFDDNQLRNALGLSYSQLSGTMQAHVEGSVALPLQVAFAARASVNAIELVENGLSGPNDILLGQFGYFELFEDATEPEKTLSTLGRHWRVPELSHKPYPTGRAAHGALWALNELQKQHRFQSADVQGISAHVPPLVKRLVDRSATSTMNVNYARLCLPYLAALMLRDGPITTASFSNELMRDPGILIAAEKIHILDDGNDDPNALSPQRLEVILNDGRAFSMDIPHTPGSPGNPLSEEQYLTKFIHCAGDAGLSQRESNALLVKLGNIESLPDCRDLFRYSDCA